MADYFLVLDAAFFENEIRPALAAGWRAPNFEPCRALCGALTPPPVPFSLQYHTGDEEPCLARISAGLPFDRAFWRLLVGEVLLVAATEIPELQTCPETLCRLLASHQCGERSRDELPPILQAHRGSRDLTF